MSIRVMWYQFFTCKHQMCGSTHSSTSSSSGVDHEDVYDNLSPVEDPSAVASSTSTYRTHGLLCDVGRHAVSVHTDNVLRSPNRTISTQATNCGPVTSFTQNLYPMATVSRGNEPVGYALSLHRTCIAACSSELRQFTEPHSHSNGQSAAVISTPDRKGVRDQKCLLFPHRNKHHWHRYTT